MESLLGKTLKNRYRVDEFVGRGGMAEGASAGWYRGLDGRRWRCN